MTVATSSLTDFRIGDLDGAAVVRGRRTTQELVFEFLRDAILSGRLRSGTHLVQDRVASELNVSRVPVREALLQLEAEGLVCMEAHRGATVVRLSPDEIAEVFEIRSILVTAAIRRVVPLLTEEQLDRLEQIALRQEERGTSSAVRARLNHAFNAILFEPLNRPRLLALMHKLEREVDRYLVTIPDRPRMGRRELVEACRDRDADRAAELLHRYLEKASECAVNRVSELATA